MDHEIDDLPNGYNGLEEWPVSLRRAAVGNLLDSRSVNLNADMTHGRVTSHRGVNRIDAKLSILWLTANTGLNPGVQRDRSRFPISEQTSVNAPATPPNPYQAEAKPACNVFSILNARHRGYPMNRKFFNVYGGGQIHRAGTFTWQPPSAIRGFWLVLGHFGFRLKMPAFGNRLRSLYHTTDFADWVVIPASSPRMT